MRPVSSLDLAEDLIQLLLWSSAESGQMMKLVQLRNLLRHHTESRNQQCEEFALRALLRNLAVRVLLRNLAVRALLVKHLAYEQASLAWISSV